MIAELKRVPTVEEMGVTRQAATLSNGMKAAYFYIPNFPVDVKVVAYAGGRFDPVGLEGTAHLLEHERLAGTERFTSKDSISFHLQQNGGGEGASTSSELSEIDVWVPDIEDAESAFEVLQQVLLYPRFDPHTLTSERQVVQNERRDMDANPFEKISEVFSRNFYKGTALGRSLTGTEDSIDAITRDDLIAFNAQNYTSGRMSVVGAGGLPFERFIEFSEKYLRVPFSDKYVVPGELPINRGDPILIELFPNQDQIVLSFGFRTPPRSNPDVPALSVIATALGGGKVSSLFKRLRIDNGLIYSVSGTAYATMDSGAWEICTSTSKDNMQQVLDIITDEVKRVRDSGLSRDEVVFVQNRRVKALRYMQTSGHWVGSNAVSELFFEHGSTPPEQIEKDLQVTPEQTRDVAQRYFNDWYLAMCGDISADEVKVNL